MFEAFRHIFVISARQITNFETLRNLDYIRNYNVTPCPKVQVSANTKATISCHERQNNQRAVVSQRSYPKTAYKVR